MAADAPQAEAVASALAAQDHLGVLTGEVNPPCFTTEAEAQMLPCSESPDAARLAGVVLGQSDATLSAGSLLSSDAVMPGPRGWVLPVWKPRGMRSRQVVTWACKVLGTRRCGHAGTLDGPAEGLVLVLVEDATRLEALFMECPKEYEAVVDFGIETESLDQTRDLEGTADVRLVRRSPLPASPTHAKLLAMLADRCVAYPQLPPSISALKVAGKRAHVLARAGAEVQLSTRDVALYAARLRALSPRGCALRVRCGKGFYMRSLGRDVAAIFDTAGSLARLRRSRLGPLGRAEAVPPSLLRRDPKSLTRGDLAPWLKPMGEALVAWPALRLGPQAALRFCMGDTLASVHAMEPTSVSDVAPRSPWNRGETTAGGEGVSGVAPPTWDVLRPEGVPLRSEWIRILGPQDLILGVFCGTVASPRAVSRFPTEPLLEVLRACASPTGASASGSRPGTAGATRECGPSVSPTEGPNDECSR